MSLVGQSYHVTFATAGRQPLLADFSSARAVLRAARASDVAGYTHTSAMVAMPDHVHWLFTVCAGDLGGTVRVIKSSAARSINMLRGRSGIVWQKGYFDHAIRDEESLVDVARYIVANPLRAGLVTRLGDYSHWYAEWV